MAVLAPLIPLHYGVCQHNSSTQFNATWCSANSQHTHKMKWPPSVQKLVIHIHKYRFYYTCSILFGNSHEAELICFLSRCMPSPVQARIQTGLLKMAGNQTACVSTKEWLPDYPCTNLTHLTSHFGASECKCYFCLPAILVGMQIWWVLQSFPAVIPQWKMMHWRERNVIAFISSVASFIRTESGLAVLLHKM